MDLRCNFSKLEMPAKTGVGSVIIDGASTTGE